MKLPFYKDSPTNKTDNILKVLHSENNSIELISDKLCEIFNQIPSTKPLVVVCVGTDRSTGDALGPLVGSQLRDKNIANFHLYGTLDHPVHALNLNETLSTIYHHFNNPFIIGIDACLGQLTSVGCIQIGNGPVKPGAGVNKDLPPVGNMHITGVVNVGGFMEYFVLQNTRLSLVMNMAEVISKSFQSALSNKQRLNSTSLAKID